jgi:surface polysaccharide O-acyltransferase-like enzyme
MSPEEWKRGIFIYFLYFEIGSQYVTMAALELTVLTSLSLNSQRSTCLCLLSAEINGPYLSRAVVLNLWAVTCPRFPPFPADYSHHLKISVEKTPSE